MTEEQVAVALYEALQDRKKTAVVIYNKGKANESYFLRIEDKTHPVRKAIAINAIKWHVPVETKIS
jgi:hypothetical protein